MCTFKAATIGTEDRKRAQRAIGHFQRATEIDSRFAAAYAGLADCYATLGYLSYFSPADSFPAARRYATKALELDPSLAEPHASLAFVELYFDWDWPGAEAEFRRAIALDPSYAPRTRMVQHLSAGSR